MMTAASTLIGACYSHLSPARCLRPLLKMCPWLTLLRPLRATKRTQNAQDAHTYKADQLPRHNRPTR